MQSLKYSFKTANKNYSLKPTSTQAILKSMTPYIGYFLAVE